MPSLASLSQAWAESDALLDELLEQMEPVFAEVRASLIATLGRLPTNADGTIRGAMSAKKLIDDLNMERSILSGIGSAMPGAVESARPLLTEVGLSVPAVSRRAQLVFLAKAGDAVKDVLGAYSKGLAGLLTQAASTPMPQRQIAQIASDLLDQPIAQARSISNTALSGLQRETTAQAAQGLPGGARQSYWLYMGPNDAATRPFCRACVGKAFDARSLSRLNNRQGLPVRAYGGGYNCRHSIIPVSGVYLDAAGITPADASDVAKANSAARR